MSSYQVSRRNFLYGAGAAAGLGAWLRTSESAAAGISPKRYMRIHRGVGTQYKNWFLPAPPAVDTQWTSTRRDGPAVSNANNSAQNAA